MVNAVSYLGNILSETSNIPAQRIIVQILFSTVSLGLLLYLNTATILESTDRLCGIKGKEKEPVANPDTKGTNLIVFAGLSLTFNLIYLFAYWFYTKKDAVPEYKKMNRKLERNRESINNTPSQEQDQEAPYQHVQRVDPCVRRPLTFHPDVCPGRPCGLRHPR